MSRIHEEAREAGYLLPSSQQCNFFRKVADRHHRSIPNDDRKVRFVIIAIDYSTKWVEEETLATITAQ